MCTPRPTPLTRLLLALTLLFALLGSRAVSHSQSWGWDESMHAGLPALRMALNLERGELGAAAHVAVECQQYPFAFPALVAVANVSIDDPGGIEVFGRGLGRVLLAFLALGAALLAGELARGALGAGPQLWMASLLAFGLCYLSPLLIDYSGTWFLEVPFAAAALWTLWIWIRRSAAVEVRWQRDLVAGALITTAFFTKFNYGLLLGLGLGLDMLIELARSPRPWRRALVSDLRVGLLPVLAFAWWFLLPLPGGADLAASHRTAFMDFLGGNLGLARTPDSLRLLDWATAAFIAPRMLLLGLGCLLVCGGLAVKHQSVRQPMLVFLVCLVPIAMHNFHLDRFLVLPLALALPLFAVGCVWVVQRSCASRWPRAALWGAPVLVVICSLAPSLDGVWLFERTVGLSENEAVRTYQLGVLERRRSIAWDRELSTAGMDAAAAGELLDLVAQRVLEGATPQHFAWLGISSQLSPGALHVGVLARSEALPTGRDASAEHVLQEAAKAREGGMPAMIMTFEGLDPAWTDEQLFAWASSFDVLFTCTPPDLRGRRSREFIEGYQVRLRDSGQFDVAELAEVQVPQPFGPPKLVSLFALTPLK